MCISICIYIIYVCVYIYVHIFHTYSYIHIYKHIHAVHLLYITFIVFRRGGQQHLILQWLPTVKGAKLEGVPVTESVRNRFVSVRSITCGRQGFLQHPVLRLLIGQQNGLRLIPIALGRSPCMFLRGSQRKQR